MLNQNLVKVKFSKTLKKVRKNIEKDLTLENKLASLAKQQPNKKILGFLRFNLWAYNRFYTTEDSGSRHYLMTHLGEPPVIFDSTLMSSSASLMSGYLVSKGYLFPKVTYSFVIKRKKATVKYFAETGPLYTIDSIFFPTDSSKLDLIVSAGRFTTVLKKNNAFDADELAKEQLRIRREFLNQGYLFFRRDYVFFQVDTNIGDHRVNVYVNVQRSDTSMEQQQYKLRNIYIYPDFNPEYELDTVKFDTIFYDGIYFLTTKHFIDDDVLSSSVYMVQGALYSRSSFECTMNRFYDLGVYKFANSRFKNVADNQVDFYFYLQPAKKHQIGTQVDVGTVESNIASGIKISYQSRNLIHRANSINLSLVGGVQVPVFPTLRYDSIFYNISAQLDYVLPKFALPFLNAHISCYNNPVTRLSFKASYFQQTNFYSLQSYGVTYSMEWKQVEFPLKKFILPIYGINYVFPTYSDSFAKRLTADPFLRESFSKQFIPSVGGAFVFSNQDFDHPSNYTFVRLNLETAGNFLYALFYGLDTFTSLNLHADSSGSYNILRINFANYARGELDVRRYLKFTQNRTLVFRISPGIAVPYGNADAVPYIKQFYLGGTNSMRAWRVRSLGPGTFRDTLNFYNSAGDFKLEGNIEYRFNIFGQFKGAVFVDAGNIWLLRNDSLKPGGTFYFSSFLQQIAVGTGVGLRWDFTYFILRLDVATPVYDPSLPVNDEFPITKFNLKPVFGDLLFQFAVGYPF